MSDNISLEPLLNDNLVTLDDGTRVIQTINPRINFEGYDVLNTDETSPNYYGFENKDGAWIIMKEVTAGDIKTFSYAKGLSAYSTAWTNRAGQSYGSVSDTF